MNMSGELRRGGANQCPKLCRGKYKKMAFKIKYSRSSK